MAELIARLRDWSYLRKWLVLGAVIGVVAGLGAIAFIFALEGSSKLLLETIGGYKPPLPIGACIRLLSLPVKTIVRELPSMVCRV